MKCTFCLIIPYIIVLQSRPAPPNFCDINHFLDGLLISFNPLFSGRDCFLQSKSSESVEPVMVVLSGQRIVTLSVVL